MGLGRGGLSLDAAFSALALAFFTLDLGLGGSLGLGMGGFFLGLGFLGLVGLGLRVVGLILVVLTWGVTTLGITVILPLIVVVTIFVVGPLTVLGTGETVVMVVSNEVREPLSVVTCVLVVVLVVGGWA